MKWLLILLIVTSCTKINCTKMSDELATVFGNQMECTRIDLLKEDIAKLIPTNCEEKRKAERLGPVCNFVVPPIVEFSLNVTVPKKYECKMTRTKEQLKLALMAVCAAF